MAINMGYCRFNNTKLALYECLEALEDGEELSEREHRMCHHMISSFANFLVENGIIEDDGELEERIQDYMATIPSDGE